MNRSQQVAFSEGERFAVALIEELQGDFRTRAAAQYQQFPHARRPCGSCAINPSTNTWRGQPLTALRFVAALMTAAGFYCHDQMPRDDAGWHPTGDDPLCAAWVVLSTLPRERLRQGLRAAMAKTFGDTIRDDHEALDDVLAQLIGLVA